MLKNTQFLQNIRKLVTCITLRALHRKESYVAVYGHNCWDQAQLLRVMLSNEFRFTINSDSAHKIVWKEKGIRFHHQNVQKTDSNVLGAIV